MKGRFCSWIPNDILVVFSLIPVSPYVILLEATNPLADGGFDLSLNSHGNRLQPTKGGSQISHLPTPEMSEDAGHLKVTSFVGCR
jgi:hypothetical protein